MSTAADTTSAVLELRDVSVDFDGFKAVDAVDFALEPGEIRFLIGPNGAGKTTLIDIVTGLTRPTSGTVRFEGDDITGLPEHRRVGLGIGRGFQTPTVFDALTVVENLDLAASHRLGSWRRLRRRRGVSPEVSEVAERVGLTGELERKAQSLAHGARRWLEIGMLLTQRPSLLLLDEPAAGMSPEERRRLGDLIVELADDHTLLVVEHDMAFLRRYARKVTVLHEGRILVEGSVEDVQGDEMVKEIYLGRSRPTPGIDDAPEDSGPEDSGPEDRRSEEVAT